MLRKENSPRLLAPRALVMIMTTLIQELDDVPSHVRVELRTLRSRLCRLYRLEDPQGPANASDVAQGVSEEDGDAVPETL